MPLYASTKYNSIIIIFLNLYLSENTHQTLRHRDISQARNRSLKKVHTTTPDNWIQFIIRAVRHRILKSARFVFRIIIIIIIIIIFLLLFFYNFFFLGGVDFRSYADWLARRQYVINVVWRNLGERSVLCLPNVALWTVC